MSTAREHLIMVLRADRTKKVQRRVIERASAGLCLVPNEDGSDCNCPAEKGGQCGRHYYEQYRIESKLTPTERAAYRQRSIAAGYRLADREICKIKRRSALQRLA